MAKLKISKAVRNVFEKYKTNSVGIINERTEDGQGVPDVPKMKWNIIHGKPVPVHAKEDTPDPPSVIKGEDGQEFYPMLKTL